MRKLRAAFGKQIPSVPGWHRLQRLFYDRYRRTDQEVEPEIMIKAWRGLAWLGLVRLGSAWPGKARRGEAGHGDAWLGMAGRSMAWLG